jgi:hypothetical protein
VTSRKASKRKKAEAVGNCGDISFALTMAYKDQGAVLCHGWPVGTGGNAEGLRYWHAWVEMDHVVYDFSNGKKGIIPASLYYEAGQIERDKVVRYSWEEADALFDEHEHSGPWVVNPYLGVALCEEDVYSDLGSGR